MRKKLVILFLLMCFGLIGCSNNNKDVLEVDTSDLDSLIGKLTNDSKEYYDGYFDLLADKFDYFKKDIDITDFSVFGYNATFNRDELLMENPYLSLAESGYIDLAANDLNNALTKNRNHEINCNQDNICKGFYVDYTLDMDHFFEAYDENNGSMSYLYMNNDELYSYDKFRFHITEETFSYESLELFFEQGRMNYVTFLNNEYRRYYYNSTTDTYDFEYHNYETNEYFNYINDTEGVRAIYYDYEDQTSLLLIQDTLRVIKYDNYTEVASLTLKDGVYTLKLNFDYMSGWDSLSSELQFESDGADQIIYGNLIFNLYNNDLEVYKNYDIEVEKQPYNYVSVTSEIIVDDLENYTMPNEFSGNVAFNELKEIMSSLNQEYILGEFGLTEEMINDCLINMYYDFVGEISD